MTGGRFYTIKNIEEMTTQRVVEIEKRNRWIVATLENGIRIKFLDWG